MGLGVAAKKVETNANTELPEARHLATTFPSTTAAPRVFIFPAVPPPESDSASTSQQRP
jgi:hypothetical protein